MLELQGEWHTAHIEKEERVEMEAKPVYIFEFGITLEQLELGDVEPEVQPRGCYICIAETLMLIYV